MVSDSRCAWCNSYLASAARPDGCVPSKGGCWNVPLCADCEDTEVDDWGESCRPCLLRARDEEERDYEEARDDYERSERRAGR